MPFRKVTVLISALVLAGLLLSTGYIAGRVVGKSKCIATVTENCRVICGVGAEFCYPDDENKDQDSVSEAGDSSDLAYLRKGG